MTTQSQLIIIIIIIIIIIKLCVGCEWKILIDTVNSSKLQWYQQPTRCSKFCFSNSFKLALHVSGDSFAHLQEHFDCIYTAFWNHVPTLPSAADRWMCHRSAADGRTGILFQKAVYTVKVLLQMDETVAWDMESKLKGINKTKFAASCWLLISMY